MKTSQFSNCLGAASAATLVVISSLLQGCYVEQTPPPSPPVAVAPPAWAPNEPDVASAHYYYLPDIEVYYDTWNSEFVYMDGGSWVYSSTLPPAYAGYNLYNQHVVVLDRRVYQPWVHHDQYVSHYPRYYYHSAYPSTPASPQPPRGFIENSRRPIYDNHPVTNPAPGPVRNTSRPVYQEHSHDGGVAPATPHQQQPVIYNGRNVGQPVRVDRSMTAPPAARPVVVPSRPASPAGGGGGRPPVRR